MGLYKVLELAQRIVARTLAPGTLAVDATVGNGHDTLFLAEHVGPGGRVYGFDVQEVALRVAEARLDRAGVAARVELFLAGHERLPEVLPASAQGRVRAVMFNLGYLPGGDKAWTTRPETTLAALTAALGLLDAGGVVTAVLYTGHPGGAEEAEAVLAWAAGLDPGRFGVASYRFLNRRQPPPLLLAVEKAPA